MNSFSLNGDVWDVKRVEPGSPVLVDRTGSLRLATTDPDAMCVYISDRLAGDMLARVLVHEIGHCIMVSYGLIGELHRYVRPEHWIAAEEWVCNFLADYGMAAFNRAAHVLGDQALKYVPRAMERLIA